MSNCQINISGRLIDFSTPQVMGIINVTPDSFYAGSRTPLPSDEGSVPDNHPSLSLGEGPVLGSRTPLPSDEGLVLASHPSLSLDEGPVLDSHPSLPSGEGPVLGGSSAEASSSLLLHRAEEMISQGATILDIGACSTRPDSVPVSAAEELRRLDAAFTALAPLRNRHPEVLISLDTFRADIASHCVRNYGVHIINDISAGQLDSAMFETVAGLRVPYVLTHNPSGNSLSFANHPQNGQIVNGQIVQSDVARFFADRLAQLHSLGVADVILDPGFGFGKTLEENYALLHHLADLIRLFPDNPFLVGVSRKSMIYRYLDITPDDALNGTTVLHTLALQAGAHILRVHDVRPAVEAIRLVQYTLNFKH